jgi:hypothetical protein
VLDLKNSGLNQGGPLPGTAKPGRIALFILSVLPWLMVGLHLVTASFWQSRNVNLQYRNWDQAAVMRLAADIRSSGNPFLTDANRHPLFADILVPFISWNREGFARARLLAILTGLLMLAVFFLLFARNAGFLLSAWLALTLALPAGLSLLFCQVIPDLLFTLWNTLAFFLFLKSLGDSRFAFTGGLALGFAFLAKYSGLVLLAVFTLFLASWAFIGFVRNERPAAIGRIKTALLAWAGFLLLSLPLLVQNQRQFGSPLYNVNSRYAWTDSWKQAQTFATQSADRAPELRHREMVEKMATDSIPSFINFFRSHSIGFAAYRFKQGIRLNCGAWWSNRGWAFLCIAAFSVFWISYFRKKDGVKTGDCRISPAGWFALIYLAVYFASISWYAAVALNLRYLFPFHAGVAVVLYLFMLRARGNRRAGRKAEIVFGLLLLVSAMLIIGSEKHDGFSGGVKTLSESAAEVTPYP